MASADNSIKSAFRRAINRLGYDIVGFHGGSPRGRMTRLLARHDIAVILDVGAYQGAFGQDMRGLGYRGRLVSFEPRREAFERLQAAAAADKDWLTVHLGLGDRNEQRIIHVSANLQSSSLLPMLESHRKAAPESIYRAEETISVQRLDAIFNDYCPPPQRAFLKIDTQGFERRVLEGAARIMAALPLVQLECSLVPLYQGGDVIEDMIGWMRGQGYDPVDLLPTFYHRRDGRLMQADVVFERRN